MLLAAKHDKVIKAYRTYQEEGLETALEELKVGALLTIAKVTWDEGTKEIPYLTNRKQEIRSTLDSLDKISEQAGGVLRNHIALTRLATEWGIPETRFDIGLIVATMGMGRIVSPLVAPFIEKISRPIMRFLPKSQRILTLGSREMIEAINSTPTGRSLLGIEPRIERPLTELNAKSFQLQQNKISGKEFQTPVHDWLRIPENKKGYSVVVQGKGSVTTIPDLPLQYGVTDIKNVKYITFTKQLKAQAALAKQQGLQGTSFNLIISPKTEKISKNLAKEVYISKGGGKIFEFNPTTQTMIERFLDGNVVVR